MAQDLTGGVTQVLAGFLSHSHMFPKFSRILIRTWPVSTGPHRSIRGFEFEEVAPPEAAIPRTAVEDGGQNGPRGATDHVGPG